MAALQEPVVTDGMVAPAARVSLVRHVAARAWWVVCLLPVLVLLAVAVGGW
jgi:hypothetical protein